MVTMLQRRIDIAVRKTAHGLIPALSALALLCIASELRAQTPPPATRNEALAAIDALTHREPRLPFPAPAELQESAGLRPDYMPPGWGGGGGIGGPGQTIGRGGRDSRGRPLDPLADAQLADISFWVVSRANNCLYCLGHQEAKLAAAGLADTKIAALDADWTALDPAQQTVLAFARKLTVEPHRIAASDIAALKRHFSDAEVVELTLSVARFNAINRWTSGLGLPQDVPLPAAAQAAAADHGAVPSVVAGPPRHRGAPPTPHAKAPAIKACRSREPRIALPSAAEAANALAGIVEGRAPAAWERALTLVPAAGKPHVEIWNTILTDDHLSPRLKAELCYVTAVHNRAWYAAATAARRLSAIGATSAEIAALLIHDESAVNAASGPAAVRALAAKSTLAPQTIADADLAAVRAHYTDAETAQILHVICLANLFDRFTEALALPLDEK
jgi:AhpD family alkylhydroperoxidase